MKRLKKSFSLCVLAVAILSASCQSVTAATEYDITEFSGGNVRNTAIIERANAFVTGDTLNILNDITSTANIGNIGNLTLIIDGNGNTLSGTNGANSYSGFITDAPVDYTFNDITIDGFEFNPTAAATITTNGGVFSNISSSGTNNLTINNSSFNNNATIATTTLTGNTMARAYGGAIENSNIVAGSLSVTSTGSDTFTNNSAKATAQSSSGLASSQAYGGAINSYIYSAVDVVTISGITFNGNYATASATAATGALSKARGGAIYNCIDYGTLLITSTGADTFTNNYVQAIAEGTSASAQATAGAIYNYSEEGVITISNIDFNGNYAVASSVVNAGTSAASRVEGGALYIEGYISDAILSDLSFSGNHAIATAVAVTDAVSTIRGGAVYNYTDIGNFSLTSTGSDTFTNNYIQSTANSASGQASSEAKGGAIYNIINGNGDTNISGISFNENYILASANAESSAETEAFGGAIYSSIVGNGNLSITSAGSDTFTNNYIQSVANSSSDTATSAVSGGAIYNNIGTGDATISGMSFNGNYAISFAEADAFANSAANGGVIYNIINNGNLSITSTGSDTFTNNYMESIARSSSNDTYSYANGGVLYSDIGTGDLTISGRTFNGNYSKSESTAANSADSAANGGAIYSTLTNGNVSVTSSGSDTFTNNHVQSISESFSDYATAVSDGGGAIYNYIGTGNATISGMSFSGNYAIESATGYYASSAVNGGAVYNHIGSGNLLISGTNSDAFTNNYVQAVALGSSDTADSVVNGGAIYNDIGTGDATISDLTFSGNYASASATAATDASSKAYGGAIYSTIGDGSLIIENSTFANNYVSATASGATTVVEAKGGAVYSELGVLTVKNSSFHNNSARGVGGLGGAIYNKSEVMNIIADNSVTSFSGNTDSTGSNAIYLDNSSGATTMNLNAGNGGSIVFDDKIAASDNTTIININKAHDAGDITTAPSGAPTGGNVYFNQSVASSDVNIYNGVVSLGVDNYLSGSDVTFYGGGLNLINGSTGATNFNNLTLNATANLGIDVNLSTKTADQIVSANPVTVTNGGNLYINSIGLKGESEQSASILIADANTRNAVDLGVSNVTSAIFKYELTYDKSSGNLAVNNTQQFTPGIVSSPVAALLGSYSTQTATYSEVFNHVDMLMFMPRYDRLLYETRNKTAMVGNQVFSPTMLPESGKGLWMKQYTAFENVPLNNGPNVSSVTYGSLVGGDTELVDIGHGFHGYLTPYVGYTGSHQNYENVGVYQNGGLLGLTGTAYKGDFFASLTANTGASNGNANTVTGTDNFTTLLAGAAVKTGYNFEFLQGKFIVQPNFTMSYTFANTFDYTNSSNVEITSDPLHAVQIAPGVKFIGNLKDGWQPYIGMNMIWNFMDSQKFYANNIQLPMMSVAPFFEYGVGLQRKWKERFTGFGQAMARGGGRNGVALQFGLRYAIGN